MAHDIDILIPMAYTDNSKEGILDKLEWARDELNSALGLRRMSAEGRREAVLRHISATIAKLEEAERWIRE